MHTAIQIEVPILVEDPIKAEWFALGIPARRVRKPKISELDAAKMASGTTPSS
jgi:hypothetical protein